MLILKVAELVRGLHSFVQISYLCRFYVKIQD